MLVKWAGVLEEYLEINHVNTLEHMKFLIDQELWRRTGKNPNCKCNLCGNEHFDPVRLP